MLVSPSQVVAKLKCHRPIMVHIAVYAMLFPTGPELSGGCRFG